MESQVLPFPPSTWGKALRLWLLTNFLGAGSCYVWMLVHNSGIMFASDRPLEASLLIGAFAAAGSVLAVPLAVPVFRGLPGIRQRSWRLLATAAFVSTLSIAAWFGLFTLTNYAALMALECGGWLYLPAALLAAAWVYRHGLFRPTDASRTHASA